MKYLQLLFIIILISACSGTKRAVENSQKETSETVTIKDTVHEIIKEVEENKSITNSEEPIIESFTKKEAFNHSSWNNLLQNNVSQTGNVNYKTFKTNKKTLLNYITSLGENMPNETWKKKDKLAFWINAYNAMTVDLILRNYPLKSIKDIKNPWEQRYWKLADKWYNLDEIEHQILRKMDEPRIHFAIICASYSCPKLQNEAYTSEDLEQQLTKATKEFLNDSERNSISQNNIELSKIFKWFSKDFEQNGSLINFLNLYSDIKISDKAKKSFKDYNWDLNE
tara:strand:+ start:1750 stop:2595 length:846 start_codon:yes stop_codon:yes gene_type:complete